ncbi:hypothetical protein K8R66_01490 [bacterium]|nr:hypothetical protein [bacterium]
MNSLKIKFQYCYGIKKLETEFDFSSKRVFAIYAPNGTMKTSFAKSFNDLSNGKQPKDLVFQNRKTVCIVQDDSNQSLEAEEIFVVEPYNKNDFNTDKISTLVVKKELKEKYDKIYKELEIEKNNFIKKLKKVSQSTDCESEFISTFSENEKDSFFNLLADKIFPDIDTEERKYDFKYNDIFDKKGSVKKFLEKNKDFLDQYIENYESIISKSNFFKKSKNTFGTYQASEILKSINDGSFFEAGHCLELNDNAKIDSVKDFKKIIEDEINNIVNDEKLRKAFDKIDKAISANVELRAFKKVIEKNNLLLVELKEYEVFRKKVWLSYFQELKKDVLVLLDSYNSKKDQLKKIISEALDTRTDWENAIDTFNARFKDLPFKLKIQNKEDVILKTKAPAIKFIFHDPKEEDIEIERDELLEILSQGERRALYILNIIFEVEARKKENQKTLFIIDDIADSFDYKNKYAIIEYLKDISKENNFYQVILTHNFDFFRSISGRIIGNSGNNRRFKLNVVKTENEIKLIEEKYQNNPLDYWKNHLDNNAMLVASIPFIRELGKYCGINDAKKLTSLLHIKSDTNSLTIQDLEGIFKTVLKDKDTLELDNSTDNVFDLIFKLADEILQNTDEIIELENKIVLSIAIRLKAENFIIQEINDQDFVDQITKNQTVELIEKYKEVFLSETENIELLEQVNLMTPENIHLNSFMYEPILDMSATELKELYKTVKEKLLKDD